MGVDNERILKKYKEICLVYEKLFNEDKFREYNHRLVEDAEFFNHLIGYELLKDDNSNLERKLVLMSLYRCGYKNIRGLNERLWSKKRLEEYDIAFLKKLKELNLLNILEKFYTKEELKRFYREIK